MPIREFDETLSRFGLDRLKRGLDLQLTETGDLATTRDGDLQLGNTQANALFRLVERWRHSETTIGELFPTMVRAAAELKKLSEARDRGEAPELHVNPMEYHATTEAIIEADLLSSTLAGAIFVILNNLLIRLKLDLGASHEEWRLAAPLIKGQSVGQIVSAAAANFRHFDEWSATRMPTKEQLKSMNVLCAVLGCPVQSAKGFPTIRSNVCGAVLEHLVQGSLDTLHESTFAYAKSLAKY